jgi:hypothetical protein
MRAISLLFAAAVVSAQTTYTVSSWYTSRGISDCGANTYDQSVASATAPLDTCFGTTDLGTGATVSFMLKNVGVASIGLYVYGGNSCAGSSLLLGDVLDPTGSSSSFCEYGSYDITILNFRYTYSISWKLTKNTSSSVGIIVGASIGGLLLCCGIGFCVFFFIVRPRRNKTVIITSGMGMSPVVNPAGGFPQQQMMIPQQQQQGFPYPMHPQQQQMMMPQQQQMMMPQQQQMMMPQQQQQMPMSPQMMPMSQQQQQQPPQTPV